MIKFNLSEDNDLLIEIDPSKGDEVSSRLVHKFLGENKKLLVSSVEAKYHIVPDPNAILDAELCDFMDCCVSDKDFFATQRQAWKNKIEYCGESLGFKIIGEQASKNIEYEELHTIEGFHGNLTIYKSDKCVVLEAINLEGDKKSMAIPFSYIYALSSGLVDLYNKGRI